MNPYRMSRDWETCSTNHDNGVEDKAIHERQSSKLEAKVGQKLTELTLHKGMCKTKYKMSPSSVRSEGGEAAQATVSTQ